MRVRLTAGAIFVALLGVAAALAPSASAESTPSAFGSRLVTLINQARADHGLRSLTVTSGTSTVAANWTSHMASQGALSHNPNLGAQLESHGSPNWTTYSENVADGDPSSADAMFTNYMNSPEHRSNILDSHMRYVGVGVVFSGGFAWNTLDFVDQYTSTSTSTSSSSTTTPTTSTAPKTTSSPKPVAQAPRTATRTTTTKTVAKTTTATRRTSTSTASHPAATHKHAALKVRAVSHKPAVSRPAAAPVAAAAHVLAAPSPVAMTTPVRGGSDSHILPLIAALGIALVTFARVRTRRVLRTH